MVEPIVLTAIKAPIKECYVVIPHGMKPIYLHTLNGQTIAYVKGWTAARKYDQNWYDLYLLGNARHSFWFLNSITKHQLTKTGLRTSAKQARKP